MANDIGEVSNVRMFVRNTEWGHVLASFYVQMVRSGNEKQVEEFIDEMRNSPVHKKSAFKYNLELLLTSG